MHNRLDANATAREFGVGYSALSTSDPMGGQMQYSLWYPTEVPNGVVRVDPYEFPGTQDGAPAAGQFGLVIHSHGSGSHDLGHWDTAIALAKAGFIAAAVLHPRNNMHDDIGDDARIVLEGRPRQFSAVIDALLLIRTGRTELTPKRSPHLASRPADIRFSRPWGRIRSSPEPSTIARCTPRTIHTAASSTARTLKIARRGPGHMRNQHNEPMTAGYARR